MRKDITKSILKKYITFCSVTLFTIYYLSSIYKNQISFDFLVILSFLFIGVLSIVNIISSLKYEFSLYKIHGYFFLVFLFLAPLYQYVTRYFPWDMNIIEDRIILGNIIIIIWQIIYIATYFLTSFSKTHGQLLPESKQLINVGFLLTIISALVTTYSLGGVTGLFTRVVESETVTRNQSLSLIIGTTVRQFPVLYFSYLYMVFQEKKGIKEFKFIKVLLIISFFILITTNFPTAVSRYHAAAVYIGLILLLFNKKISFDIMILIGITFIFPTLELFRRFDFSEVFSNFKLQTINLSTEHFDAYSMIIRTIEYVLNEGPSYGYQLLGALFFFIPRSVWPSKPGGSGAYVGEALGLDFLNISSPLVAEVLLNFGFVFFILGPLLLGAFSKKIDTKYWGFNKSFRFINIYFLYLIGFFFFILRGDLLSSFAYTIGFYVPLILLGIFSKILKFK